MTPSRKHAEAVRVGVPSQKLGDSEPRWPEWLSISPSSAHCLAWPCWLTLEALGSCLPQGEEDVTHDSGAAHAGLGDDSEDAIHILPQALLQELGS